LIGFKLTNLILPTQITAPARPLLKKVLANGPLLDDPNNQGEILSWRIFWMTMLNRSAPTAEPTLALDETEIGLLDHLVKDKIRPRRKTLGDI
jgi:hypothetical protein